MEVGLLTWWILKKDSSRETCVCKMELTMIFSSRCHHNICNSKHDSICWNMSLPMYALTHE
jgi:hypothetical protein